MSELVSRSLRHLFKLLKVYLMLALLGALGGVIYAVLSQYPQLVPVIIAIGGALYLARIQLKRSWNVDRRVHPHEK